jgi:hypothetical protein
VKDSEFLAAAQSVISVPQKWVKGELTNDKGRYCAVGALYKAFTTWESVWVLDAEEHPQIRRLRARLNRIAGEQFPDLASSGSGHYYLECLNDHLKTHHVDIMKVYEKARAELEEQGQ